VTLALARRAPSARIADWDERGNIRHIGDLGYAPPVFWRNRSYCGLMPGLDDVRVIVDLRRTK